MPERKAEGNADIGELSLLTYCGSRGATERRSEEVTEPPKHHERDRIIPVARTPSRNREKPSCSSVRMPDNVSDSLLKHAAACAFIELEGVNNKEVTMINRVLVALVVGLAAASFASPSFAQDMAKRDAAVAKCSAEAQQRVPNQETADQVANRTEAYAECMKKAGFTP